MDFNALDPILDLRFATRRALADRPLTDRGDVPDTVAAALKAREAARAALAKDDDDAERLIASIVDAARAPLRAAEPQAPKAAKARSTPARKRKKT